MNEWLESQRKREGEEGKGKEPPKYNTKLWHNEGALFMEEEEFPVSYRSFIESFLTGFLQCYEITHRHLEWLGKSLTSKSETANNYTALGCKALNYLSPINSSCGIPKDHP